MYWYKKYHIYFYNNTVFRKKQQDFLNSPVFRFKIYIKEALKAYEKASSPRLGRNKP